MLTVLLAGLVGCSPTAPASPRGQSGGGPAQPPAAAAPPAAQPPAASAPALAASPATAVPAPTKIAVTYSSKSANQLPLWVAAERGYFVQHGIDAELVFLSSTLAGQGLIANSVQFGLIGAEGIDLNLEAGSPVTKYIAGVTPKLVLKVVAHPDVRSFQDLRDRHVAATRQGSVTDFAWRKVLERNGMQAGRDATIVYSGSLDAMLGALLAGHVQAAMVSTPMDLQATKQGMSVLADVEKMDIPYMHGGQVVRTDYATANPDVVERYLKAHLQGVATTLQEPEAAMDALARHLEVEDRELLRAGYETFRPTFTRDQLVPEAAIVATLQESLRPSAKTADPKDFYDNSYLERIKASGFIDRLYAGR